MSSFFQNINRDIKDETSPKETGLCDECTSTLPLSDVTQELTDEQQSGIFLSGLSAILNAATNVERKNRNNQDFKETAEYLCGRERKP